MEVNFESVSLYQQLYINPEWMNRNPTYKSCIYFDEFISIPNLLKLLILLAPPPPTPYLNYEPIGHYMYVEYISYSNF